MDPIDEIPPALREAFREEATELLADMEDALIQLEESPGDAELVARAFRALHTIKGNAVMFGFEALEKLAHELEHVFDLLRKGRMRVSDEIVSLTLAAKDRLQTLLYPERDTPEEEALRADIARRIVAVLGDAATEVAPAGAPEPTPTGPEPGGREEVEDSFMSEAGEILLDLEVALMELERTPGDREVAARAFHAFQHLREEASRRGLVELVAFASELESAYDQARRTDAPVGRELIDLTLEAAERIGRILTGAGDSPTERALREREIETLHRVALPEGGDGAPAAQAAVWKILLRPGPGTFAAGTDPLMVLDGLRALGRCEVRAHFDGVPALDALDPEACYLWWEVRIETDRSLEDLRDALIFVGGEGAGVEISREGGDGGPAPAPGPPQEPARQSAEAPAATRTVERREADAGTLRVGASRLDTLVNLVGELVTVQARLSRHADLGADPALVGIAEEVERLTGDLRDITLGIRMVPVRPAFGKFRRLVRDLARDIGREVEFATEGEETELDKTVIDRLGDPIVHILRNCIDHGIEPPEERVRAGKPRRGRVSLSAAHAGASVVISVEDDGRGIDLEAVRRKAIERGLLGEHEERGERELQALLFAPGFSTSARVTSVSGRGVGLDVVKRAVESLRGSIRIERRNGGGTVFEVRLPLTLAIIEGLAVAIGEERFIVPLAAVRECVELAGGSREGRRTCEVVEVRGEVLPFVRLREWFAIAGEHPEREQIVVTEAAGRRVGLLVDGVIGEHQTVIKPLGRLFRDVRGLGGSTILGDGTVALILDVEQLVHAVEGIHGGGAA